MKEQIRSYIVENLLKNEVAITDDSELYSSGLLSSMAHLKLVNFIERTFDVTIPIRDISINNFDTINQIVEFTSKIANE